MSNDAQTTADDAPKKKKGGFMKMLLMAIVLLGAGGGGTYAAFATGMIGGAAEKKEDTGPEYVLKGEEDPYAVKSEKGEEEGKVVHGSGGSKYRTAYYEFQDEFTSNLAGGIDLVQISLAASTHKDGRVLMWLHDHELAIRSRILVELASTDAADISTAQGKEKLQQRLTKAINDELIAHEGFGGVDNVYFRSLIIQ
ncbi:MULTISPECIES: flagellar basal body-associated FliL family protein [Citromicrobium]|mgnify:FL=1|jgi:flagellar protein FliL|uniref:flagellar basal body-associated FliL family protein n=1 Tax=Citromicrobium TaxID=72173 RepID=UPI0001DD0CCB|nr:MULTISPECIES: flagellar basal body-associated FliL family protein [Citromicrobium]MAO04417.1 flagellar basal body-associated protein FliL [Citromicrobium sp.]ALG59427.1 flagellar basal body-associated protein FliL [Citromicrobium sp. JL477]KPM16141.1 flagellar basal body-associated protein FliL [Citromicrobium sp. JL1351]KPM19396.1 flagellar basal body-associated protein FliL [Citromicrobium sp. JL31]KPM23782.1 flagellar basal body-associated protein FliL [Citromicrobium sp. JL2201]|tara:strand:+ start:859 stop:1449 length:591 start_codon:yes stop_codon:yes gene_type:complete